MNEIYKIYLIYFFSGLGAFATFLPLFLLSNGLNQTQLAFLISINIFTTAILNIPTGGIADTYGHKFSVFLGTLVWSISFLFFFIGHNFFVFLLGMFLGGVGLSFVSGALISLTYDILERLNKKDEFKKVYSWSNGFYFFAAMIAASASGFVYKYNSRLPFLLAFIFTFIAALSVKLINSTFKGKKKSFDIYYQKTIKGISFIFSNKILLSLIIVSVGSTLGMTILNNNIRQPYLIINNFNAEQIGLISAFVSGVSAVLYMYGYKMFKKLGDLYSLTLIVIITTEILILMGFVSFYVGLILLVIYLFGPSFREPLMSHLYQKQIDSEHRATANSTISFIVQLFIALLLPVWGMIIDKNGLNLSLIYLGIFTGLISCLGLILYRWYIKRSNKLETEI